MGAGSVTASTVKERLSWRLTPPHDQQTQGIVVSGFSWLPAGKALFLHGDGPETDAGRGPWLQTLMKVAPVTASDGKPEKRAAAIAFTWTGLQKAGLSPEALATFAAPFREGMYQEDRLRRLGDKVKDKWQEPVIDGGPLWSGNIPADGASAPGDDPDDRACAAAALRRDCRRHSGLGRRGRASAGAARHQGRPSARARPSARRMASAGSISASPTGCRSQFPSMIRASPRTSPSS